MNTVLAATAGSDVVGAIFDPLQELFTGSLVPAIAVATVAAIGLSVAIKKASGAFKRA